MLRELQTILNKNTPSNFKAEVAMVTGMGVVKDLVNTTVELPAAEQGVDIVLVNKERIPTGINTARGDMSDYDENFTAIAANEFVKFVNPVAGERYATDQFDPAGLVVGNYVAVGTNGKWKNAAVESIFKYGGIYNDAGHNLAIIDVAQAVGTN